MRFSCMLLKTWQDAERDWVSIPPSLPFFRWGRAFLNSNPKKSPELSISRPGNSYGSVQINAVQVQQARKRFLALLQGCLLLKRKNQTQPLHHRRQGTLTTIISGLPSAQTHWKHNASGMPGSTMMSSSGCKGSGSLSHHYPSVVFASSREWFHSTQHRAFHRKTCWREHPSTTASKNIW